MILFEIAIIFPLPSLIIKYPPSLEWLPNEANWSKFTQLTEATDTTIPQSDSIDQDVVNFTEFILQATNQSIPKSSPKKHFRNVPWWFPELKVAIANRNRILNQFHELVPQFFSLLHYSPIS